MFGIGECKIWLSKNVLCESKLLILYILFYLYLTKLKSILLKIYIYIYNYYVYNLVHTYIPILKGGGGVITFSIDFILLI